MKSNENYQLYTITSAEKSLTLEQYLKDSLHYSGRQLQQLTRSKGIFINKKPAFLKRQLKENDVIKIKTLNDSDYGVTPEIGSIEILYEDDDLIVLNKPPFQLVHPTGQTSNHTLSNYLAGYFQRQNKVITIRPVHRLDRDTSGCIIFAKTAAAQTSLEKSLQIKKLKRNYLAIVSGIINPSQGTIDLPIGKHPQKANQRAIKPNGDRAITNYSTQQAWNSAALLSLNLETGRTHQIRVHLAHLKHALIGDKMYGKRSSFISRQALHANAITFIQPTSQQQITIEAPLPTDMNDLINIYQNI